MKPVSFWILCILLSSCASADLFVKIPAQKSVEIDIPSYDRYDITLRNKSLTDVEVEVQDKATGDFFRGFGLGPRAKATVFVEKKGKLILGNSSNSPIGVKATISESTAPIVVPNRKSITFTLANKGAKSIPLLIPTVMNPNLSPFSTSGVELKIGQEILFREKGKKYVLLTVSSDIQEGELIDVGKLLRKRKSELGLR